MTARWMAGALAAFLLLASVSPAIAQKTVEGLCRTHGVGGQENVRRIEQAYVAAVRAGISEDELLPFVEDILRHKLELVLGWGSTYGAITSAVRDLGTAGITVSQAHLRHLNPLPRNLGDILGRFHRVLVPEMNTGQLALLLRARYLKDVISYSKVQGQPFKRREIMERIQKVLES